MTRRDEPKIDRYVYLAICKEVLISLSPFVIFFLGPTCPAHKINRSSLTVLCPFRRTFTDPLEALCQQNCKCCRTSCN